MISLMDRKRDIGKFLLGPSSGPNTNICNIYLIHTFYYFFTVITMTAILAVEINDGLVPNEDARLRKF